MPTLKQVFHYFRGDKDEKLVELLQQYHRVRGAAAAKGVNLREEAGAGGTLIFCADVSSAKHAHAKLATTLPTLGPILLSDCTPAADRVAALQSFREGSSEILIATMFAARGLDFPALKHVTIILLLWLLSGLPLCFVTGFLCA